MKVLIATDSFKDALPAKEVGMAIASGLQAGDPLIEPIVFPLADGGEGTIDVLRAHLGGHMVQVAAHDPLMRPMNASYCLIPEKKIALIEMAAASGIELLKESERHAGLTSTYGTGELILDACKKGVKSIYLGIGSSATNDAGIGMAAALGYRFLDKKGAELMPVGKNLQSIEQIDDKDCLLAPKALEVKVFCDVNNPLYGPAGAAFVYGPQKGGSKEDIQKLDASLQHFARFLEPGQAEVPGAGAAGGMGAGLLKFLDAELRSGIDLVLEITRFQEQLSGVDLILTGEGKIDNQSLEGKLISGVCRYAQAARIPVIAFCGTLAADPEAIRNLGLQAAFSIMRAPMSLEDALAQTQNGLHSLAFQLARTIRAFR